jgi:hypothetical protein
MERTEALREIEHVLVKVLSEPESIAVEDQLKEGIEVEKEHEDLYNKIKSDVGDSFKMTLDEFAEGIAQAHIKEDDKYYSKLKMMGL